VETLNVFISNKTLQRHVFWGCHDVWSAWGLAVDHLVSVWNLRFISLHHKHKTAFKVLIEA
jgi:hypothetical protein